MQPGVNLIKILFLKKMLILKYYVNLISQFLFIKKRDQEQINVYMNAYFLKLWIILQQFLFVLKILKKLLINLLINQEQYQKNSEAVHFLCLVNLQKQSQKNIQKVRWIVHLMDCKLQQLKRLKKSFHLKIYLNRLQNLKQLASKNMKKTFKVILCKIKNKISHRIINKCKVILHN